MTLKGKCYLGVTRRPQWTKRRLLAVLGVYRITDHGPHLKINTTKALPRIAGLRTILVRDRTTHFDARYWDFALDAFRHATKKRHTSTQAIGIVIHYLYNLFGLPEAEHLDVLAANRHWINATMTDMEAHGWEIVALRKAGLLK